MMPICNSKLCFATFYEIQMPITVSAVPIPTGSRSRGRAPLETSDLIRQCVEFLAATIWNAKVPTSVAMTTNVASTACHPRIYQVSFYCNNH